MMVIHLLALNYIFAFFITTIPHMVYYYSPVVLFAIQSLFILDIFLL